MSNRRILIMTAVEAEREAVLRGLGGAEGFEVALAGVGPASAAARTAQAVSAGIAAMADSSAAGTARGSAAGVSGEQAAVPGAAVAAASGEADNAGGPYRLVISAGIGGGFPDRAPIGSLVVADAIMAPDLGAETPEGFRSVDELGFGSSSIDVDRELAGRVAQALANAGLPAAVGTVLTVTTVTGSSETAAALAERVPGAAAEAMEGYGVALAASLYGLPAMELRAVSNAVGPRDRGAWRIKDALQALEAASHTLAEVLR
jgi:futalosine hydrolase